MGHPRVSGRPWVVNLVYSAFGTIALSALSVATKVGKVRERGSVRRGQPREVSRWPGHSALPVASHDRRLPGPASGGSSIISRLLRLSSSYRRAEQARSQLVAIVESSSDAIIGKSLKGIISSWNRGAASLYGYSAEEVLGKSIAMLFPAGREDELRMILARIRRGERIDHYETTRVRKDGSPLHVSISVSPIKNGWGRVVGAATIGRDISDRIREQQGHRFLLHVDRVLASSLDHHTLLAGVASLVVQHLADCCAIDIVEEDGTLRPAVVVHRDSPKATPAEDLSGEPSLVAGDRYCMPSVVRTGIPRLYSDVSGSQLESPREDQAHLTRLQELGVQSAMVLPMIARGRTLGGVAFVSLEGGRQYDESDLALAEELSHRVALAVDNVRLFQDAQRAIRVRDEFLSVAAHELRTPVTSLHGFAQFALRQLDKEGRIDQQRIRQGLQVIDYQSKKLSHLVSQLLSVSAIEGGTLTIDRQMVDLTRLVEGVVNMARTGTSGHQLLLHAPPSMPAEVDPLRLEQVVINLIDNAIKYSPNGGLIEVELSSPTPDSVRLSVRDHGIGVPPEHLGRVFERLYRGHNVDNFSGMGLGLYISREVVRRHGGEIRLESPEEGGTICVVTLPAGLRAVQESTGTAA